MNIGVATIYGLSGDVLYTGLVECDVDGLLTADEAIDLSGVDWKSEMLRRLGPQYRPDEISFAE